LIFIYIVLEIVKECFKDLLSKEYNVFANSLLGTTIQNGSKRERSNVVISIYKRYKHINIII